VVTIRVAIGYQVITKSALAAAQAILDRFTSAHAVGGGHAATSVSNRGPAVSAAPVAVARFARWAPASPFDQCRDSFTRGTWWRCVTP
jgi:hypothetical protein